MKRQVCVAAFAAVALGFLSQSAAALDAIVKPQSFTFAESPNEVVLENGQKLGPITVVYDTYGKLDPDGRNGVLLMHGMGGTAHAAGQYEGAGGGNRGGRGWWDGIIGPGKPFDTDKYFIISPNSLAGGHRDNKPGAGTTGPMSINPKTGKPYGITFPTFSIRDMVRVNMELLKHLGVKHLVVVSGVSMGGYESLEFICTYPDFVDGAIPVVGRGRSPAQHSLDHFIRRMAIMNDPDWQGGNYYGTSKYPVHGMALASMAASRSYNNAPSFNDDKQADVPGKSPYDSLMNDFKFEGDMYANALRGADNNVDANNYLYQSKALTNQNLGWKRGDYSRGWRANLTDALKVVQAAVLMMPSKTDDSVRPEYGKEIVDILRGLGKKAELHVIDSERGHSGSGDFYEMIPAMTQFIASLPGSKGKQPPSQP